MTLTFLRSEVPTHVYASVICPQGSKVSSILLYDEQCLNYGPILTNLYQMILKSTPKYSMCLLHTPQTSNFLLLAPYDGPFLSYGRNLRKVYAPYTLARPTLRPFRSAISLV